MESFKTSHDQKKPFSIREIRRACDRELYRTIKRLKIHLSKEQVDQAHKYYFEKVLLNIQMITENKDNRKLLADWWEINVGPEVATMWNVDPDRLSDAFRRAFGG
jgi:hypothetical protein